MTVKKSSTGAMLRSAILPGWGQLYNGQKLKAALVFGGGLAIVGNAIYYNQLAVESSVLEGKETFEGYRSRALWWLLAFYVLNILDAYVDAELWDFDTGPDLGCSHVTNRMACKVTFRFSLQTM